MPGMYLQMGKRRCFLQRNKTNWGKLRQLLWTLASLAFRDLKAEWPVSYPLTPGMNTPMGLLLPMNSELAIVLSVALYLNIIRTQRSYVYRMKEKHEDKLLRKNQK